MAKEIATATLQEFDEYQDVILRIATRRGSSPIIIVDGGRLLTAQEIGEQILNDFKYGIESKVFDLAKERKNDSESL